MRECQGLTRWALATLLLLGACANGADAPAIAVPQAPSAGPVAQSAGLPPADPAPGDVVALESGREIAALDASTGRGEPDGLTAIVSSAADSSVDEILGDLKSEPESRFQRRRWSRPTGAPPPRWLRRARPAPRSAIC